jgi:hypothetical protein
MVENFFGKRTFVELLYLRRARVVINGAAGFKSICLKSPNGSTDQTMIVDHRQLFLAP